MESALTVKGQITIPKSIREHLHVGPGDRVKFFVYPDGTVVLLPKLPISSLRGMLRTAKRATAEEMDKAITAAALDRYRRATRR